MSNEYGSWAGLPFELDENCWGTLNEATEECPGVYYVCTSPKDGKIVGRELYVVTKTAIPTIISPEVVAHGIIVGDVWVFEYTDITSIYNLVKYEVMKYRIINELPIEDVEGSLYCAAIYNTEYFPWYFGGAIPPRNTPFGLTVRVKKAGEGLFFLETEQGRWVLAVSFPIWDTELSEYTKNLGWICDDDLSKKAKESRYLFFTKEGCAPAIYELLKNSDYNGLKRFIRSREVLETNLWEYFPEYALEHNAYEMSGKGSADMLGNLLKSLGVEIPETDEENEEKAKQRVKNCIIYSQELVGQDLLLLR